MEKGIQQAHLLAIVSIYPFAKLIKIFLTVEELSILTKGLKKRILILSVPRSTKNDIGQFLWLDLANTHAYRKSYQNIPYG